MLGFVNLALFLAFSLISVPVVGLLSAFFLDWLRVRYAPAPEYAEETFVMNLSVSLALSAFGSPIVLILSSALVLIISATFGVMSILLLSSSLFATAFFLVVIGAWKTKKDIKARNKSREAAREERDRDWVPPIFNGEVDAMTYFDEDFDLEGTATATGS